MASAVPICSVIVPTCNRPTALGRCLYALADQTQPADRFEVIVVDDGGTTDVRPLVHRYERRLDLRLLRQPRSGPAAARNRGAKLARGSLLVFTDDDAAPDPQWLAALARRHAARSDEGLGGRTLADAPENAYARASQRIIELAYLHYNGDPEGAEFFASTNLALPAEGFREIGGFDTSLRISEDRDLCDRWLECGHTLRFIAEAVVKHTYPSSLRDFATTHFRYGGGAFAYQLTRRRRGLGLSGIDPSFYSGPLRREASAALRSANLALLALLALWQAVYTAGFASAAGRAAASACLHVSSKSPVKGSTW